MPDHVVLDADGYAVNFAGQLAAMYAESAYPGGPYSTLPLPVPSSTTLKSLLDSTLHGMDKQLCDGIHARISSSRWQCDIPTGTELRAKMLGHNLLALRYIAGCHLNWDQTTPTPLGSWADPTIDATFDAVLEIVLEFAPWIDGANPANAPAIVLQSSQFHLRNAHINSGNVVVELINFFTDVLSQFEQAVDTTGGQTPIAGQQLIAGQVATLDGSLHSAALALSQQINQLEPGSNSLFLLNVTIEGSSVVIQFRRDSAVPKVPTGVKWWSSANDVNFQCDQNNYIIALRRQLDDGTWAVVDIDRDTSRPITPQFSDTVPPNHSTATYRVCNINDYGEACAGPFLVTGLWFVKGGGGGSGSSSDGGVQPGPPGPHRMQ